MSTHQPDIAACRRVLQKLASLPLSGDAHRIADHCLASYLASGATQLRGGVGDLAGTLGLHRNTVGRALSALVEHGVLLRTDQRGRRSVEVTLTLVLDGAANVPHAATPHQATTPPVVPRPAALRCVPDLDSYNRALERAGAFRDAIVMSTYHAAGTPSAWVPRPEWGLSAEDIETIRSCIPDRSKDLQLPSRGQVQAQPMPRPEPVPQQLALALQAAASELLTLAHGDGEAVNRYLREISFSVLHGGLGRGNVGAGVQQAIRIVRQGRWGTPFGMPEAWNPDLSALEA